MITDSRKLGLCTAAVPLAATQGSILATCGAFLPPSVQLENHKALSG